VERSKRSLWAVIAVLAVVALGAVAYMATSGSSVDKVSAQADRPAAVEPVATPDALRAIPPGRELLVRSVAADTPRSDGRLYEISSAGVTSVGRVECKRVHANAAGAAVCFGRAKNGVDYDGIILDHDYQEVQRFPINGVPDRARISPDGRYGAYTAFDEVSSQGYFASTNEISTNTRIFDMRSGRELIDLADLKVTRDGRAYDLSDAQLWGVTFAEGDRFYATLASSEDEYLLIEGHVEAGRARTIGDGVECPALSPDGRRIAYKRRLGKTNRWRLHVRNLDSGRDVALAERRSIDDQPEWLGNDLVTYSDDKATFAVPADGTGQPQRIADHATSGASL
jgi:hypothetical protein